MDNTIDTIGFLTVNVRTANGAIPIEGALVNIYENIETDNGNGDLTNANGHLIYSMRTDSSGQTEKVALPTKNVALSLEPGNVRPFMSYNVFASKEGYFDSDVINMPIFQGITSVQPINLIPLSEFSSPIDDVPFYDSRFVEIPDNDL
ncbi:MAG: hypothetical protein J6A53_00160 [Clostridia bacterium]|nr:hypothetical protein [Clostridia bacterium]MBO5439048.1 hypothetical protein [Clostridia bacterium]